MRNKLIIGRYPIDLCESVEFKGGFLLDFTMMRIHVIGYKVIRALQNVRN